MQQRLGVTAGLDQAFKHQIARRLESHRSLEVTGHGLVQSVTGILARHLGAALHVALADHGARVHGGVHFVAGGVQETGIVEGTILNWMFKEGAVK